MRLRVIGQRYMIVAIMAAMLLCPMRLLALRSTPLIIEPGDRLSFLIPVANGADSATDMTGLRLEILSVPSWMKLSENSVKGPIDLPPGERMVYRLDYEVGPEYTADKGETELVVAVRSEVSGLHAAQFVWHFRTSNGFLTYNSECLDEAGNSFGGTISPDRYPPGTYYRFEGRSHVSGDGTVYISPQTGLVLEGIDAFVNDAVSSEVFFTGYVIDASPLPTDTSQLTPYSNAFFIEADGTHSVIYSSSDNANNVEPFKSFNFIVDGTAPAAPVGLKADGVNPSPWKNVQEFALAWTNPSDVSGIAGARVKLGGAQPQSNEEGDFYPANNGAIEYTSPDIANGANVLWVWLEDNVGNAAPATAKSVVLRYDDRLPAGSATVAISNAAAPVPISFSVTDEGFPETGSGPQGATFWYRYDREGDGVFELSWVSDVYKLELSRGIWSCGSNTAHITYPLSAVSGTVNFNAGTAYESGCGTEGYYALLPDGAKVFLGSGIYQFYIQGTDAAGNTMPAPGDGSTPTAQMNFDNTAPVISGIAAKALSPSTALIEWATDEETTAIIDYGRNTSLGSQFTVSVPAKNHSVTLTSLPSPADIYFRITAVNKTSLTKLSSVGSFKTPLDIAYTTDIFGIINYDQPVTLTITNPDIAEATLVVDGQTWSGTVTPGTPVAILVDPAVTGGGNHSIVVNAGTYEYTSSFIVDNAVRTVKLARLVIDSGGIMSPEPPAQPVLDATVGQDAQEEMSSASGKLFLGYYAGVDPAAPGQITDLTATAGPNAGQINIGWTAPGDDGNVGTAMKYDIRYSPDPITAENFLSAQLAADIPVPKVAGTRQSLTVSGLENGKTYYFAIKALDEVLNSALSDVATAKTLEIARSAELMGGDPVVEVVSPFNDLVIKQATAESTDPAVAVARGAAPGQSLMFYSEIFEITPSRTFENGAQVNFRYSDLGDPDLESGLKVYKFDPAQGEWVPVESVVDTENNTIRAVTYSFSLYAVFGIDHTPPVTSAALVGGTRYNDLAGNVFVSGAAKLSLNAVDPSSGTIDRIEYRVDSASGPFETYSAPVNFAAGWHSLQYRSLDKAGNEEAAKSLFVMKDALEPRIELNFEGDFARLTSGVIHVSSTSGAFDITTMDQPSSGSGLKKVRLELDGVTQDIPELHSVQLTLGRHVIRVWAEDNVGNIAETNTEVVVGDLLPPVVTAPDTRFVATNSTIPFSWQHQTTNFFSLTEYDLMIGAEPGFIEPQFTHTVSSHVAVTIGFSEAGVSLDGLELHEGMLRLITEAVPDHLEGTLEGTVTTPWIGLPQRTTGITGISASQELRGGTIVLEYSLNGVNFSAVPADGNILINLSNGGSIKFRARLSRAELATPSPIITNMQFTVNYQEQSYYYYCHRHCYMCQYHCHSGYNYTDKSYYTSLSASSPQNTLSGLRISNYWVELITDECLRQSTGTLTGAWQTQPFEVPELAYRVGDFSGDFDSNEGQVLFEFSKNGGGFRPLLELDATSLKGGDTVSFKAILSRADPNKISPVFRGISFNFILPPPTGAEFHLPQEGKYYWRVASKDYLGRFSAPSEERLIIFDTKPPITEIRIEGAIGQNGWNIVPVSVAFDSTDAVSNITGTYYSVDGASFTRYSSPFALTAEGNRVLRYYSADEAGNTEAQKEFTAKIDLSSPTITASLVPAANEYGWNKEAVGVIFGGSDTVSGLAYCTSSSTVTGEGVGQQIAGVCFDNAGLSSTRAVSVSIDMAPPSIEHGRSPAANEYGWNASSVTLTFSCDDVLSGVKTCPAKLLLSAEGLNVSTSVKAFDYAGNSKALSVNGINIDKTLPVSSAVIGGTFRNGWHSSPVTVTLKSTDSLSGILQTQYSLNSAPFVIYQQTLSVSADGAHALKYYAADRAGNTEPGRTIGFSIDRTVPQTSFALSPQSNANGWHNTAVNVVFNGTDTLSGIESCYQKEIGIEGAAQPVAGWCSDKAGNIGYSTATVSIDLTRPSVRVIRNPVANVDGWNNGPVTVRFSGEDALSGIGYCTADKTISSEGGGQLASGTCDDKAGNATAVTAMLNIDVTTPEMSYSKLPAPNASGWNNTDVTVEFSCTDALSGVKVCPADIILASEGVNISTSAETFDLAGNSTQTIAIGIKIDKTAPQLIVSSPAAGNVFVATKDVIRPFFSVVDNLDPAPALSAFLVQTEDRGSVRGNRPARVAVTSGQSIEPLNIDDGIWQLQLNATDFADNAAAMAGGTFEVIHDVLAPASTVQIIGTRYDNAGVSYVKRGTLFTLSSLDDLVQAGDGIGLGVKRQRVTVSTGAAGGQQTIFDNPLPKQGETFVSTFTFGQAWSLPDGRYDLAFSVEDLLGNIETLKHASVGLDDTAPEVSAQLTGTTGDNDWHISTVTITLLASDNLSGVAGIHYKLNDAAGDAFVKYFGTFATADEGGHELAFFADDNLGNAAARQAREFKIDRSAPLVAAAVIPDPNSDGWHNGVVKSVFTGSDTVSGIAYCESPKTLLAEGRGLEISGYCRDYAGLSSTATARFNIDLTSPTITVARSPLANAHGWNNTDVTAVFICSDELSSIKYCPPEKVFAAEGAGQGVSGAAVDRADNSTAVAISEINIDKTAPQSALSLVGDVWQNAGGTYLSPRSSVSLSADDPVSGGTVSGVEFIEYRVSDAAFGVYVSSFGLSEGVRTLEYRAADKAGNVEVVRSAEFHVDGTPPASTLSIAGVRHDADGLIYLTSGSGIVLTSSDPVNAETASGVLLTKYRIDGGNWQVYASSFTVAGEGRHTLEYYSLDRVLNSEALKTAALAVDNTAPLTAISLGAPRYEAFGLPLITPDTPVILAATDVQSGEVASGLKRIFYEAVNAVSGSSGARAYTEPFKLPQGTWDIRYWSEDNLGNTEAYKQLRAAVTTLHAEALSAVDGLDLSGTADISGPVKSNGTVAVSGNARILGDVTASTITLSGSKAQITGQRFSGATPLAGEPILLAAVSTAATGAVPPEFLAGGRLVVSSQSELTLTTGTYYFKGIELSGGCKVDVDGKVDILVDGDVLISGGSAFNAAGAASALQVFVKGSSVTFTGGGSMAAVLYAPYAQMKLAGNSLLGGHYFVRDAFISGNGNIVQAGETLPAAAPATGGGGKKVSALASGASYSVLAGPDPEFKPGEVYVYPNPAKGGAAPTLHMECGIADSVKINIYTVSGREAHSAVITSLPVSLDDGNGLAYAYEYTWRGHIPSGVYYYVVEAEKSGRKIKKTGKFGVVR